MQKLVFITGASSGIGQALSWRFYAAGYQLALVARRVDIVASWASQMGISESAYKIYGADVCDVDRLIDAANACIQIQGLPDVVIANAGISVGMDTAIRADINVMAKIFATNNVGMAATFHPFIEPLLLRYKTNGRSARFVGIASVAGIRGLPGHGAYCASKAAVISYCESLRGELRHSSGVGDVNVVTICPGYVDTPLTQKNRYSMPFLMAPDDFADKAFKAIERGKSYVVIPWQMGALACLLKWLPNAIFDRLLANRPRKDRTAS
ncbi:MAG: SDR family oxidoreductase [Burkholderiaceae bacterium]